jgi:dTDP-4-dehydrorhamnose reductase
VFQKAIKIKKLTTKRIIIGESGLIARHLIQRYLKDRVEFIATTRNPERKTDSIFLDLSEAEKFDYSQITSEDHAVLLASISSPDFCMKHKETAYRVNVKGTCRFIEMCLKRGARVLFFSSDTVYGRGSKTFDEESKCAPVGAYGAMKREVELAFADEPHFKCFRLSYVFAQDDKFTQYLYDCLRKNKLAEIYHPLFRSVVYIGDVLDAIEKLCQEWNENDNQAVNICGDELLSRKDMAELFREKVSMRLKTKVVEPGEAFFEARPRSIHIVSKYLSTLLGRRPAKISDAMTMEFKV